MTCRQKLTIEFPRYIGSEYRGGCMACPSDYGYLPKPDYCCAENEACAKCWDREIPSRNLIKGEKKDDV